MGEQSHNKGSAPIFKAALAFCGVVGLGRLLAEGNNNLWGILRRCPVRTQAFRSSFGFPRCLYICATPSEHTINFYLRLGCTLVSEPDPKLFELEPEDIHLVEYELAGV